MLGSPPFFDPYGLVLAMIVVVAYAALIGAVAVLGGVSFARAAAAGERLGATGEQRDRLMRAPLYAAGLPFAVLVSSCVCPALFEGGGRGIATVYTVLLVVGGIVATIGGARLARRQIAAVEAESAAD